MHKVSRRFLTVSYIAALSIIALLSITSHLTLDRVLQAHEGSASVVNISGRQRMLSQRIASLAAQYALGAPTARADLITATDEFDDTHRQLLAGNEERHLPAVNSPELKALYFAGDHPLDKAVRDYVASARHIADLSPGDPALAAETAQLFAAARQPLLEGLNDVVKLHEIESDRRLLRLQWLQKMVLAVVLGTLLIEALMIFRPMVRRIAIYHEELMRLAATDPLTGALNRRGFFERGLVEVRKARRSAQPVSFLMVDIDHFKKINDSYGHKTGDIVLKRLMESFLSMLRAGDLTGRLGGEEFGIVLPDTTIESAERLAQRLCDHAASIQVEADGKIIRFTISIGVADFAADATSLQATMDRADVALYKAKETGRNCVVTMKLPPAPIKFPSGEMVESQI